ncbi:phospholipase D-like domain-containing protein [Flavobacterium sp. MAHUQ-51]|uniref:phospholipase D-like domain-containing protein n=1 Tax=Flavobacterium sp. GCM10022190 TaxID=3252639 RepID=UPI0036105639
MRTSKTNNNLKVNAIAGTYVVTLGFDLPKTECNGLLGFSILRTDEKGVAKFLEGMKCFEETDPGFPAGALYPSNDHPIQIFQWADYSAEPGKTYSYKVTALKGSPTALTSFNECTVEVTTEDPEGGNQDVYFNRGTAASQEYIRRFGDVEPDKATDPKKVFKWLSRGLYEALEKFIASCEPGKHALRIAAYEFNYEPLLKLVEETIARGVDIKIVYDAKKKVPGEKNKELVATYHLDNVSTPRTTYPSGISHNKFIVKLENGNPIAVWTGGTNFSDGGIFGHSNVAHVVEESNITGLFLKYWNALEQDLDHKDLPVAVENISTIPPIDLPVGTSVLFSPRKSLDALNYYGNLALTAKKGLFMTFAFGMNKTFKEVYRNSEAGFRLALLEKKTRPYDSDDEAAKLADEQEIQELRDMVENVFAVGNFVRTNKFDGWVKESLTGLNSNVNYVHNKFMLIDPLSDDPIVICGSANFSDASTIKNDENMLLVRGNTRIADIYLGEFMRLFSHFSFRESLQWRKIDEAPKPLRIDNWWESSFGDTSNSAKRKYFAQVDH